MSRLDRFDRIIASLHEAMLDETRWQETSMLIDEACGITGTHLVIVGGQCHDDAQWLFDRAYWHGEDREELGRDYAENYFPRDERIPRLLALPDRRIVSVVDLFTEQELKTSPTYNELLRRAGARGGLNIRMDGPNGIHILWALADPTDPDGWRSDQIEMLQRLLPHIRQFVRIRQALAGARALNASLAGLLDNTMTGVICLDRRGTIVQANSVARAVLRHRDGLVDRDGYLRARLPAEDARLRGLLADALPRSGALGVGASMTVRRSPELPRFTLHVTPVVAHDAGFGSSHVASLVLIVDPVAKPSIDPEHVAAMLGLTPAESRVCGGAGRRRYGARNRRGHESIGGHRTRTGQARPRQARHLAAGRLGADRPGDRRGSQSSPLTADLPAELPCTERESSNCVSSVRGRRRRHPCPTEEETMRRITLGLIARALMVIGSERVPLLS